VKKHTSPTEYADEILNSLGSYDLPIDIKSIIESKDISIAYEVFDDDLSGLLIKHDGGRPKIGVNAKHSATRQRFTLAHELAHFVLEHQGDIFVDHSVLRRDGRSSMAIDQSEIDANQFAADLLMPREDVRREFVKTRNSGNTNQEKIIKHLAKMFFVSPKAMEYRLVNLNLIIPT
jgi:Zn-dependent peptidase ImmA (M78 family)